MKRLTGRIGRDRIGALELRPIPMAIIDGFRALADLTGAASDALDQLGRGGVVPASVLAPIVPGSSVVGRALTVENVVRESSISLIQERALRGDIGLADIEAHNLAEPGDVLVVKGHPEISSMGRISSRIGRRQGELGAVVDGAVRDLDSVRSIGYPIWARGASPKTGKYRLETVSINRPVTIAGTVVHPGDLVLADSGGVVFVPAAIAGEVLALARAAEAAEEKRVSAIDSGTPVPDLGARRDP